MKRGRSLMDPQPHPLLHFLIWMKPKTMNVFLQVAKNVEVTREKMWAVRRMLKCFPAKSLKLIPPRLVVWGRALSCKRMIPSESIPRCFDFMAHHSTLSYQETKHTSLLCLLPFPILDEHTLHYAHLQSNKETTVWTCVFSLCMSPTLQMAVSIHNNSVASFCEECFMVGVRFSFDCPSYESIYCDLTQGFFNSWFQ